MSREPLIPNAVGRLDDVVEASAAGDVQKASKLLFERGVDVKAKRDKAWAEFTNARKEFQTLGTFMFRINEPGDFAERVRVACGGSAEVKASESDLEIGFSTMLRTIRRNCDDGK